MCVCEHYTLYILPSVLVQLKLSARMHSEGCFVSVCVCLSVTTFSATTRNETTTPTGSSITTLASFLKKAILIQLLRSKVMT